MEIKEQEHFGNPIPGRMVKCAQFDSKRECHNLAQEIDGWTLDFCAKHNHMVKTGISLKCWKCGDN